MFPYGGNVTATRTVGMAQMSLRPAHLAYALWASSSVKTGIALTLVLFVMVMQTAPMAQMRTLPSAVGH